MKLTLLLLTVGLLQARANGYSQQLTMDVKDASLVKVFAIIKQQTGYVYFGATDLLAKARPVTIKVTNAPLETVLQQCFKDQPLDYMIDGKTISVFEKKKGAGTSISLGAPAPMLIDIRGRVTNEENEAVAGVSVLVKGTRTGTHTDGDGEFSLSKVNHDAVLVLTAVNIQSIEAPVGGQRNLELKVKGKTGKLDEVQVIAYGKTSQRYNVGNVTTVKAEDIEKQPVTNPLLALQGRVPGLEVTQLTGMNGGGVRVRIQGRNSIQSGLEPLIVIDGVPFPSQFPFSSREFVVQGGSPLNYVNPADIESIDILKDADATAIYGSRAANGAILITTKKGKQGKAAVTLNLQEGWGKVTRKIDMMNTRQYLDMRYEALRNDGLLITAAANNDLRVWDTTRYTDWQKVLIGGTARYTNIGATLSGGTPTVQYRVGGTYNRQTTVFPGAFANKSGTVHFNINGCSANQRLQMQFSGSYTFNDNQLPGGDFTRKALLLEPNAPALYNPNGSLNWAPNATGNSTWDNPLAQMENAEFTNNTNNLVSNINLRYRLLPGFTLLTNAGFSQTQSSLYLPTRLESIRPESRPFSQRRAVFGNRTISTWLIEPQLQYEGKVGAVRIDGLLGSTIQKGKYEYRDILGQGFATNLLMKTLKAATTFSTEITNREEYTRFNALFGRLNFNWSNKYLLNLNARRDGSNKFGDANKFHNFWSVGAGWIFSEETGIQLALPLLSFGKLRTSYGLTGNDAIAPFAYLSLYAINNPNIAYQNSIGLDATRIPNPHLQWEETRKWQSGIDLGFWQDRLLLSATYARNRSSNQLVDYALPTLTGFNSITRNLPALIQNTSWEFTLNTVNIKHQQFTWSSSANFTIPRNKLVNFPGIEETPYANPATGYIPGYPLGIRRLLRYAGINPADGQALFLDKNGNPASAISGTGEANINMSLYPSFYAGLTNTIQFKGIQLDCLFQLVRTRGSKEMYFLGEVIPGRFVAASGSSNQPVSVATLSRWQKPGDLALLPPYSTQVSSPSLNSTDIYYTFDASYIRLKNLSLSWQLPAAWIQKGGLQQVSLYMRGQNLWTITKYTGLDPESGSSALPPLKLWTIGGQLVF